MSAPCASAPHWWTTPRWRCARGWRPARGGPATGCRPSSSWPAMLGVSRGTLRTALDRLEEAGEITRRQGSGTYVGQPVRPTAFHEGLEVLRPYSALAERRGVALSVRDLEVAERRHRRRGGRGLRARARRRGARRSRARSSPTASPVAVMRDVVRPGLALPPEPAELRARWRRARWCSTCCSRTASPVAFAVTRVRPRMVSGREQLGRALGVTAPRRCSSSRRSCTWPRARRSSTRPTCSRPTASTSRSGATSRSASPRRWCAPSAR